MSKEIDGILAQARVMDAQRTAFEYVSAPRIYRIIRFRQGSNPRTIRNNVTLTEAQAHCSREDTHGIRGGVRWFDGYDYMRGCAPRGNKCATQ